MPIILHSNKLHINDAKVSGALDIITYETQESLDSIYEQLDDIEARLNNINTNLQNANNQSQGS